MRARGNGRRRTSRRARRRLRCAPPPPPAIVRAYRHAHSHAQLSYVGRPALPAVAVGTSKHNTLQQEKLLQAAFEK